MKSLPIRRLLFPLGWLYGCITFVRNKLFDWQVFPVFAIPIKSICVGNLSVGGTGKTPHVTYLADLLKDHYKISILSRGYGRRTKGYRLANLSSKATEIGDEPLSYVLRFTNEFPVAVCESRKEGVNQLLATNKLDLILLDDAFQHRKVKSGLSIVLTEYSAPFFKDAMLPAGNLREYPNGIKRADILVVTKCPKDVSQEDQFNFILASKFDKKKVFFSYYSYGQWKAFDTDKFSTQFNHILLVTGIANPEPLLDYLSNESVVDHFVFKDHHAFNLQDIQKIHAKFDNLPKGNNCILTTEKDYMRLKENTEAYSLSTYPWFYVPIKVEIINSELFNKHIFDYVESI